MAKKLVAEINIEVYDTDRDTTQHHINIAGEIKTLAESLAIAALQSPNFEQALNLAILQIREAKAAQG